MKSLELTKTINIDPFPLEKNTQHTDLENIFVFFSSLLNLWIHFHMLLKHTINFTMQIICNTLAIILCILQQH